MSIFTDNNNWENYKLLHKDELREDQIKAVDSMLLCCNPKKGFFYYYCRHCDLEKLIELIKAKLGNNFLLVLADAKKKGKHEYFSYEEATFFSGFKEKAFKEMIKDGRIIWEFRLHLKSDTAIRDHGSGFRTARRNLSTMYDKEIRLL